MSEERRLEIREANHRFLVVGCFWTAIVCALTIKPVLIWSGASESLHTAGALAGAVCGAMAAAVSVLSGFVGCAVACQFSLRYWRFPWQGAAPLFVSLVLGHLLQNGWGR